MRKKNTGSSRKSVDETPGIEQPDTMKAASPPSDDYAADDALDIEETEGAVLESPRQFVTFHIEEEIFAVPIDEVQEIVRMPDVVRVPLAPMNLCGLANLRGQTLPIISLRNILGHAEQEHTEATRVLVVQQGCLLGFVVDQVSSVVSVDSSSIESTSTIHRTVDTNFISGVIKNVGNSAMALILDLDRLIKDEFSLGQSRAEGAGAQSFGGLGEKLATDDEEDNDHDQLHLVSFSVDEQEYAIPIDQVREIVQVPEQVMHVPNAAPHVLGIITLRNRLLPLVSLRQMFGLRVEPLSDRNRIIVINQPADRGRESAVGIVTDMVNEVLRVDRQTVDDLPSILAQDGSMAEITAIGRLDNGKRLVSLLSPQDMFQHASIRTALDMSENMTPEEFEAAAALDDELTDEDEEQVVVFRLGDEEFGVDIEAVHEIVRVPDSLTRVPKSPAIVEGVINLRGTVLPVIDQRRRFDLLPIERNDRQRIMVLNASGTRTGFIVDCVTEVMRIPRTAVELAPQITHERSDVMRNVANLPAEKRMILLIDAGRLLSTNEARDLRRVAA